MVLIFLVGNALFVIHSFSVMVQFLAPIVHFKWLEGHVIRATLPPVIAFSVQAVNTLTQPVAAQAVILVIGRREIVCALPATWAAEEFIVTFVMRRRDPV